MDNDLRSHITYFLCLYIVESIIKNGDWRGVTGNMRDCGIVLCRQMVHVP